MKVKIFIILIFLYFNDLVKSTDVNTTDFVISKIMEDKFTNMSQILEEKTNQLEQKVSRLIKDNMVVLEEKIQKSLEVKITNINQKVEEKMKIAKNFIPSYNVQDLKCSNNRLPKSCADLNECHNKIYNIMIPEIGNKSFPALCDLNTLDGGWTVIQRRQDGSENFFRNWTDYVKGFGNLNGEFFIGLEKLYALTALGEPQELYIFLQDFEENTRYARYGQFKVDSESTGYELTVRDYSGNAGDCFTQHSGYKFSTVDRDNDVHCAKDYKGAWWYTNCFHSNLNGLYLAGKSSSSERGISWCGFREYDYSLKYVRMMIRPKKN